MSLKDELIGRVVEPAVIRFYQWRGDPLARWLRPESKTDPYPFYVGIRERGLIRRQVLASDRRRHALFLVPAAEPEFLAARDKVRAFEGVLSARTANAEKRGSKAQIAADLRVMNTYDSATWLWRGLRTGRNARPTSLPDLGNQAVTGVLGVLFVTGQLAAQGAVFESGSHQQRYG